MQYFILKSNVSQKYDNIPEVYKSNEDKVVKITANVYNKNTCLKVDKQETRNENCLQQNNNSLVDDQQQYCEIMKMIIL